MTVVNGEEDFVLEVNVNVPINVLLVAFIGFTVITALTTKGMDALVPQPKPLVNEDGPVACTIATSVDSECCVWINKGLTTLSALGPRTEGILKARNERVMFVQGGPGVDFADVAAVIDIANGAGIDKIGLITKAIETSS
jgi:biopolymer transport protein ExbD